MKKSYLSLFAVTVLAAVLTTACGGQAGAPQNSASSQTAQSDAAAGQAPQSQDGSAKTTPDDSADMASDGADATAPDGMASPGDTDNPAGTELPDDSIGAVCFTPNEKGYSLVYGSDTLHAYFQRLGVIPGSGKMQVRRLADDSVVEEIDLLDAKKCTVEQPDSTFQLLGWDNGTHLAIHLGQMPEKNESYYVTLQQGAFTSADKTIASKEVTDSSTWCYGVAPYGISPSLPNGSQVYVGDVIGADLFVQAPAVLAKLENYDENRVRFNDKEFEQSGKLEIKIYQIGDDPFTVTFYDADDDPLGSITLCYTASMPPEPQEEAPRKSVTDL